MRGGACVFTIIALAMNLLHTNCYDYCAQETEAKLCPNGTRHIMCEAGALVPQASFMSILPMTNSWRHFMLDQFNNVRNFMANNADCAFGQKFPKAARLRELIWDWELAYLASAHANRCSYVYDNCRNTVRFPDVGQFMLQGNDSKPIQSKAVLKRPFNDTLSMRFYVAYTTRFVTTLPTMFAYDHEGIYLAILINERASRVGCGAAYCEFCESNRYCLYMTCNLNANVHEHGKIFTISESDTASDCSYWNTEKSSEYEHLCANSGEIFG